jgi:ADP-heptose:LPS heptosyltransferase|tara:strand:+ start:648 stop:1502 length:855 start_codon:yes stop_codon:yes gene_type:complete
MGLGGYLTWTAVAREIFEKTKIKSFPIESINGGLIKIIKSEIFANNPYLIQDISESDFAFPLILNNPKTNYCKQDTPEKAIHRYDKHIVEQICEFYGIVPSSIKPEIYFSEKENQKIDFILNRYQLEKGKFLVIEPQSNNEYTANKKYPLEKWQHVVENISKLGMKIVQVGKKTSDQNLKNVINLTGLTTFREASLIISHCKLFISSEGGLMHSARAVETPSVIVYTGFIHPVMTGYPENKNIWIGKNHGPCGMKIKCDNCEKEVKNHDPQEIVSTIVGFLEEL